MRSMGYHSCGWCYFLFILASWHNKSTKAFFPPTPLHNKNSKRKQQTLQHATSPKQRGGGAISTPFAITRRKILGGIAGAVITVPLLAEAYARGIGGFRIKLSSEPFEDPEQPWDSIEDITLVFHGAGGQDNYTDELMNQLAKLSRRNSYEVIVDWSEYSQNLLKASFDGQMVGRQTANELLDKARGVKTMHIIGISVGAFAADAFVTQVKERLMEIGQGDNVYVQLTLLDPFSQRGVIGLNYGDKNFGKSADYAQQFLNTDDPVPSTNAPLSHCAVTDVTKLRPPDIFGHDWPLVYFSRSNKLGLVSKINQFPPGVVRMARK